MAKPFIEAGHSRVEVNAEFNGNKLVFHGKLHARDDRYILSFGKRYQKQLGVAKGDFFQIQLLQNTTKYGVEMSEELSAVFESDPQALEKFELLTDGKKRSLIYHILRIKNSQTRIDKALIISENLKMGVTDVKLLVQAFR